MSASARELANKLSETAQKHEKKIVIDFGIDRILHVIGVYSVLFLAVFTEVLTLTKGSLVHCFGENNTADSSFREYAQSYCERTFHYFVDNGTRIDVSDAKYTLIIVRAVPVLLLVQAGVMLFPFMRWHVVVGGRLSGHLAFVRVLLDDVYRKLQKIPRGYVENDSVSYDAKGEYMNPSRKWQNDQHTENTQRRRRNCFPFLSESKGPENQNLAMQSGRPTSTPDKSWFYGDTRDSHFFSLLCYENFAFLENFSYIICYQKLVVGGSSNRAKTRPILQAILDIWSNQKNLSSKYLVRKYIHRLLTGFVAALIFVVAILFLLIPFIQKSQNSSYSCSVVTDQDEVPIRCTVKQLYGVLEALILDLVFMVLYAIGCVYQWWTIRNCSDKASSRYFQELNNITNVALHAVDMIEDEEEKGSKGPQKLNVTIVEPDEKYGTKS